MSTRARIVQVAEVLSSRYSVNENQPSAGGYQTDAPIGQFQTTESYIELAARPLSWDARKSGIDRIRTVAGEDLLLRSDGMQSTPKPGWLLLLVDDHDDEAYRWTLYGIPRAAMSSLSAKLSSPH